MEYKININKLVSEDGNPIRTAHTISGIHFCIFPDHDKRPLLMYNSMRSLEYVELFSVEGLAFCSDAKNKELLWNKLIDKGIIEVKNDQ